MVILNSFNAGTEWRGHKTVYPAMICLSRSMRPTRDREQRAKDKQDPEDRLVSPRYPHRQIDVEVVTTILGVSRRHVGEWASKSVEDKYENFHQDDAHKPCRLPKAAHIAEHRNRRNAKNEQQPNGCMDEFD
jgi:hypothetical protein